MKNLAASKPERSTPLDAAASGSGVLVQGGEEQRLLVGKVGVGDTPSYTGVPGDVSD